MKILNDCPEVINDWAVNVDNGEAGNLIDGPRGDGLNFKRSEIFFLVGKDWIDTGKGSLTYGFGESSIRFNGIGMESKVYSPISGFFNYFPGRIG